MARLLFTALGPAESGQQVGDVVYTVCVKSTLVYLKDASMFVCRIGDQVMSQEIVYEKLPQVG